MTFCVESETSKKLPFDVEELQSYKLSATSAENSFKYTFEELVSKETFGNLDTSLLNYIYITKMMKY